VETFRIQSSRDCFSFGVFLITLLLPVSPSAAAAALKPHAVDAFFIEPERPTVLELEADSGELPERIQYRVFDYTDVQVAAGKAIAVPGKIVQVALKLPQGYYDLEFPATEQRFGLFVSPAWQGKPDPFFGIDRQRSAADPGCRGRARNSSLGSRS